MLKRFVVTISAMLIFVLAAWPARAQEINPQPEFFKATVTSIESTERQDVGGYTQTSQVVKTKTDSGEELTAGYLLPPGMNEEGLLKTGQQVVLVRVDTGADEPQVFVSDFYRLPNLYLVIGFFFLIIVAFTGLRGLSALAGLGMSVAFLLYLIVPQIAAGADPMLVSLVGAFGIGGVSLYLAHGFNTRTTIALISTFITLVFGVIAAISFVSLTNLFGLGSAESLELQYGVLRGINLKGLLLAGMIIGALGVLDDITTAQAAAIEELHKANHKLDFYELYQRGMSIGKEHIISLVNTLALAYAGAALPLMLLFTLYPQPWWVTLNSEFISEEIVRTIVGSLALTLAVPITTALAAWYFTRTVTKTK